ncbi:MAG: hypothetical protein JNM46_03150 [Anaerolineales bacterium]|nr:hypothetical protein [Anaerolineales bacterium]
MSLSPYELALKQIQSGQTDLMPSDILAFSEPLRSAVNAMVRLGRFSLTEFTEKLTFTREETKNIADALVKRKLFEIASYSNEKETFYLAHLSGSTRPLSRPPSDIWKKID